MIDNYHKWSAIMWVGIFFAMATCTVLEGTVGVEIETVCEDVPSE